MKKRKIYEISVIDKTYSKIISDETKFYTSDTALELVFKLKETEYTFESAEIVLLNIDDRSLVTRPVTKVNNDFMYELDDDIIPHYGEWRGQLRFEAGETYVSSPVKFRIENDLSNDRPPQLSDVQSWVSLKRYADKLTEELKQAVLSVEGIEDTFNVNELERQDKFETAEQSRQTTFEMAESERDETFVANENTRQTQELEREGAETTRQQAENQRQSTFETKETERKNTFEAAEQERQQAESIRIENENQRKTDHVNRSAELASKADKVVINNLIRNGDFSNGTTGWSDYGSKIAVEDSKRLKVINNGGASYAQVWRYIDLAPMSKYYFRAKIEDGNKNTNATLVDWFSGGVKSSEGLYELLKENASEEIVRRQLKFSNVSTLGDYYYISDIQLINLTATFGAGKEPTREEMGELIKLTGYIDGEYALNNKEMLIWTLALIRRNKNAIVALGGA